MKNFLLISVFLVFSSYGLFADSLFSFGTNAVRDVFSIRYFTGDFNVDDDTIKLIGSPYPYQGDPEIRFFYPSMFVTTSMEAWIRFRYETEKFGTHVRLSAYSTNSIDLRLSEWQGWIRLGPWFNESVNLRLLAGNLSQRGKIPQYENFSEFLKFRKENMGVMIPINNITDRLELADNLQETLFPYGYGKQGMVTGYADFIQSDSNNMFTIVRNLFYPEGDVVDPSGFLIDIETDPVTLSFSVGGMHERLARPFSIPWEFAWNTRITGQYDSRADNLMEDSYFRIGFRAESARIMDMLTLAAVCKYTELEKPKEIRLLRTS